MLSPRRVQASAADAYGRLVPQEAQSALPKSSSGGPFVKRFLCLLVGRVAQLAYGTRLEHRELRPFPGDPLTSQPGGEPIRRSGV